MSVVLVFDEGELVVSKNKGGGAFLWALDALPDWCREEFMALVKAKPMPVGEAATAAVAKVLQLMARCAEENPAAWAELQRRLPE